MEAYDFYEVLRKLDKKLYPLIYANTDFIKSLHELFIDYSDNNLDKLRKKFDPFFTELEEKARTDEEGLICWMDFTYWDLYKGNRKSLEFFRSWENAKLKNNRKDILSKFYLSKKTEFPEIQSELILPTQTNLLTFVFDWKGSLGDYKNPALKNSAVFFNFRNLGQKCLKKLKTKIDLKIKEWRHLKGSELKKEQSIFFDQLLDDIISAAEEITENPGLSKMLQDDFGALKRIYKYKSCKPENNFNLIEFLQVAIINRLIDDDWEFNYIIPAGSFKGLGIGGCFIATTRELNDDEFFFLKEIVNKICGTFAIAYKWKLDEHIIYKQNIKTAIIAILVDSFAHNISAHSLSAIVWLFLKRIKEFGKQFSNEKALNFHEHIIEPNKLSYLSAEALKDQERLGIISGSCNEQYLSLKSIIEFMDSNLREQILSFSSINDGESKSHMVPEFPVPIENELHLLFKYLKDKSAFWSGITRDLVFGGTQCSWYDVINDFCHNPLFLGTIAHSEGFNKISVKIGYGDQSNNLSTQPFIKINISDIVSNSPSKNKKFPYKHIFYETKFKHIRERLSSPEYCVFMPGGIVARHALYTIFENTIRNIKHTQKSGKEIQLNIYINSSDDKLFQIYVWLGNKSANVERVVAQIKAQLNKAIINKIGKPRLGGIYQDKLCASMLFNNQFSLIENRKIKYKSRKVHPWIEVKSSNSGNNIVRSLYVWRGTLSINLKDFKNIKNENPCRVKFVILKRDKIENNLISELGFIRILTEQEVNSIDQTNESELYQIWNCKWLRQTDAIIALGVENTVKSYLFFKDDVWQLSTNDINNKPTGRITHQIMFAHPGGTTLNKVYYRNHGPFRHFYNANVDEYIEERFNEFLEILLTNIIIVDNRIHNRVNEEKKKVELYSKSLYLKFFAEKIEINKLIKIIEKSKPNFIVLHLSYVESLAKKNQNYRKYSESELHKFIKDFLPKKLGDNCKLIITTGRGRYQWWESLIKNGKPYVRNVYFKPVELLISAVEDGLISDDDFMVKHNLIKALFGS